MPAANAIHTSQGSELQARWRNINADEKNGSLPASLLHSYLCIILALIEEETCPRLFRMNRIKVVGGGGLLALAVHFKAGDRFVPHGGKQRCLQSRDCDRFELAGCCRR